MHGNVAEWCADEKLPYIDYAARNKDGLRLRLTTQADGQAREARRVVRGGSVHSGAIGCRCTARNSHDPSTSDGAIGVRPIRRISVR